MGSDKTYIFDGGGSGGGLDIAALVSSMMGNKGMDPNLVAALMNGNNNRGAWGGDGCWWIWIILLFFCWGGNGFGFGGNGANGLPAQLNGDAGRELLMNAIQGNGTAITQLASSLNCSTQQIQSTLCNIQSMLGQFSPMQQFINISIEGNEPWGVPMLADIVSKDGLTVATTREVLKPTIMEAQQASRDIVESFDRHKANLKVYDEILMQLDPEAARSKELEAENRELRKMLADMNERLSQIPTAEELRSLVKSEPPAKTK